MGLCDADWIATVLRGSDMRTPDGFRIVVQQVLRRLSLDAPEAGPGIERAFRRWMAQLPEARPGRDPALTEAAGLIRALLEAPLLLRPRGGADACAAFWPDGVAAFVLALCSYAARRAPDRLPLSRDMDHLPLWWSIRENLAEEQGLARPFLQALAGEAPNWRYWASHPPDVRPPGGFAPAAPP